MSDAVVYRTVRDDELPLVYNSFLRSLQKAAPYSLIANQRYFAAFHDMMERWIRDGQIVAAAIDLDDGTSEVIGWAVGRRGFVGYVYVKYRFRGRGIGRELVRRLVGDIGFVYEVCTPAGGGFIGRISRGYPMWATYRPPAMKGTDNVQRQEGQEAPEEVRN